MVEMLIQAEANLAALIESTEDHIWSVDLNDRLTLFNRAFQRHIEKVYGVRAAVGMHLKDLFLSERLELWQRFLQRALSEGPFSIEYVMLDGRTLYLAINPVVVDGKATGISVFGKDITERKAAESAIREAEAKYRDIFDGALEGIFQTSVEGKPLTANPALARMLGYDSPEEILSTVSDVAQDMWTDPKDRDEYLRQLEEQGVVRGFECQMKRKDGGTIWASLTARKVCGTDGRALHLEGFITDITERKRAERELAENEARFRSFFEENSSVMLLADPSSGEIVAANQAAAAFYGYPRERLVGMTLSQVDTLPAEELARDRQQALNKERRLFAYRARLASGEERDVEVYSSPFVVDGRQLMCGIIHDVTERKRAEAQLRDSEERFRSTFEQAAIGIVHASFAGRILRCNEHFANQLGYSAEELSRLTIARVTFPEDLAATEEVLQRILEGAVASQSLEKRYLRKDGSVTWEKLTVSLQRDGEGRAIHFVALAEDINARKAAENRLAEAQEALRRSEERHRVAFQTSANAVNIVRLDDGMVLDANKVFLDSLGFEQIEVVGRTWRELGIWADPSDIPRVAEELQREGVFRGDVRFRKKDGEVFWGRMSASVFEHDGVRCALSVTQDISETKIAEEQLAAAAEALRASEERYRTIFQTSPDAIIVLRTSDGVILDANKALLASAGYERDEFVGHTTQELDIWVNGNDRRKLLDELFRKKEVRGFESPSRRRNGEIFWMRLDASMIEVGGIPCMLAFAQDISEARAAQERLTAAAEALRASEERYRTVFHTSLDCITLSRLSDGGYIDVNKAFLDLIGIEPHEIAGRTSMDLGIWAHPETRAEIVEMLRRNPSFRDFQTEFVKKSGEIFWVLISASVIEIGGVPCLVSIVRDISGAKAAESTIQSLAFYDPLTGLPNRRLLFERLHQALAADARSGCLKALLLVDLDNLKTLNDTLGHRIGDLLLQEVARRIAACARKADTVGRLGGDEFVVILEDLSEVAEEAATQAKAAGEKILASIGQPFLLDGRECLSAASIGITIFADRQNSADDTLQKADIALHLAKADGRNTVRFFSPALQTVVNARATLEEDLRRAIKTKQFLLYYQPQVNRGRMTGVEALIRWKHPRRGIVPPDEFIPLAEESRLILPLGDWVLEAACKQIVSWAGRSETARLTISVNISALQFRQPEFVEHVLAALDRTGANPKNLKLELTESMLVDNFEEVIAKMTELKSHGLGFSLDDFGTGYSSLAYLKRLPLDQLKIDRSFVRDMLVDLTSGAIAQTIISLGRAMDMSVMAEGVETEEQRGFLAGLGCHSFQGFLFSRPLPLEQLEAFLEEIA
jgi:diguanylate cyclase (GGDEF)-like protein/PAS domain S-box-containing protein